MSEQPSTSTEPTPALAKETISNTPIKTNLACLQCNYQLTNLSRKSDCPECGYPIEPSYQSQFAITQRQLTALLIRLMAIYFLTMTFITLDSTIMLISSSFRSPTSPLFLMAIVHVTTTIFKPIISILLIIYAPYISKKLIKSDAPFSLHTRFTPQKFLTTAFIILGTYFLVIGAASLISFIYPFISQLFDTSTSTKPPFNFSYTQLTYGATNTTAAIILIFGHNKLASFFTKLRTLGTNQ
ncbi:hypothetical protein JD969_11270 [Planctomycetota bacterium]|nr:hypothetical protein JD969_11270 [Planctomycetota bacterium]